MKKVLSGLICAVIIFSGCADAQKPVEINKFLVTESVALTQVMCELANDADYNKIFTVSDEMGKIVAQMAAQNYAKPEKVYLMKLPDTLLRDFLQTQGEMTVSDALLEKIQQKWNATSFASMLNGYLGVETLAASSVVTWEKSYIQPKGWTGNVMLLLDYDGEFSSLVSFTQSGDGVINAASSFLKDDGGDLMESFSQKLGGIEFEVVTISGEELDKVLSAS